MTVPAEDGLVLEARGRRLAVGIAELAIALIGIPLLALYHVIIFEGFLDLFIFGGNALICLWALGISGFAAMTSSVHARPTGLVWVGILKTTTAPWGVLRSARGDADHLAVHTFDGQDVSFMLPIAWIKEADQRERVAAAAQRLTARIRLENARTRLGTIEAQQLTRRWRPAGFVAIMLCAVASAVVITQGI